MIDFQRALDYFIHDYRLPDGKRVIERFAAEHGKRLSAEERALIEGWQHSRLTAFEVIAVERGVGMRLRDLVSGEEFDVREKRGTQDLNRWEILVSRLMRTGNRYEAGRHQFRHSGVLWGALGECPVESPSLGTALYRGTRLVAQDQCQARQDPSHECRSGDGFD